MRDELWSKITRQLKLGKAFPAEVFEVNTILEFNGPQIVSLRSAKSLWLAVAADDDEEHIRWLVAPVSEYELESYLRGGTTTRNCLNKPTVTIVDLDYSTNFSEAEFVGEVPFDSIPEEFLPEVTSFLPDEMIHLKESQAPTLTLDGDRLDGQPSFQMFGEVLVNTQRLWDALGQYLMGEPTFRGQVQAEIRQRTELQLAEISSGSVKVQVKPIDNEVFDEVASEFKKLVTLHSNGISLYKLPGRVRSTYLSYAKSLGRYNISMVTEWQSNVAYISSNSARSVSRSIRNELEWEFNEEIDDFGFFVGFDLVSERFLFRSEVWPGIIEGKILGEVVKAVQQGKLVISLEKPNLYHVGLMVFSRREDSQFFLTSVVPMEVDSLI